MSSRDIIEVKENRIESSLGSVRMTAVDVWGLCGATPQSTVARAKGTAR